MNDAAGAIPPPLDASARESAISRLAGVFFSPVKTFESIGRRPTWLAPLLIWTALSLVITTVMLPRIDFDKMIRGQMEKRGQTVPEDRIASAVETQKKIAPVLYNAIAAVSPAIISLLVAVVFLGAFKAFGWDVTFRQSFGVTAHAFLPGVLGSVLLIPILLRQESINPQNMGDMLRSNLGFLVERDSSKALHSLLQSLDIFSFWSLALLIIGFAAAARVSRQRSATVVVALWALYVLGKTGLAALF